METKRSLTARFLGNLGWCYVAFAVFGFPLIVVESSPLAVLLLVPVLVALWVASEPPDVDPTLRY